MNKKRAYLVPQVEVIEIAIEDSVLSTSTDSNGIFFENQVSGGLEM